MLLPVVWVAAVNYLLVDRQILCNKAGQCIQIQNSWLFFSEQCAYLYTTALSLSINQSTNQSDWHFFLLFLKSIKSLQCEILLIQKLHFKFFSWTFVQIFRSVWSVENRKDSKFLTLFNPKHFGQHCVFWCN